MEHCHAVLFAVSQYPLVIALFLGAVVGSLTHCAGMCGPFVLAQIASFSSDTPKIFSRRGLLIPYHLGRLTTYCFLGVIATALASPFIHNPAFQKLAAFLLLLAGLLFIASAFSLVFPKQFSNVSFGFCAMPAWITNALTRLLPQHSLLNGYVLGMILGFLPCGLVYAAIAAVMATGSIMQSFAGMFAFAVGTMPLLMLIGISGKLLLHQKYQWIKPLSALIMVANGMVLFAMANK